MELDLIVHSANVLALAGGAWAVLKIVVPAGLSVRDALHDTATELRLLGEAKDDHERRIRDLEYSGPERRKS